MNYACHSEPFTFCRSEGVKRPKNLAKNKLREESGDPSLLLRVTNSILFFSLYLKEAICAYAVEDGKSGTA